MTWRMTYYPQRTVGLPVFQFDKQRATCERCAHFEKRAGYRGTTLSCGASRGNHSTCSVMREAGSKCGPAALLFKARPAE